MTRGSPRARGGILARSVALVAVALIAPLGWADTFTPPFDHGEAFAQNQSGTTFAEHFSSPVTGGMELFSRAVTVGHVEAVARLGGDYVLNSGDLLTTFTAPAIVQGDVLGTLNCVNLVGGTVASLTLRLQIWHWDGAAFVLEQSKDVREWRCPVFTLVLDSFVESSQFTFEPGETYRVVFEAMATAHAESGSEATADFCSSGTVHCGVGVEEIDVDVIEVPNQAPKARFDDQAVWYVTALVNTVSLTGRGCDVDGSVASLRIWVTGQAGQTITPVGGACGNGGHNFLPLLPSAYTGNAEAKDDEGATALDQGQILVTVLPPLDGTAAGFPDIGRSAPKESAVVEAFISPDGDVTSSRVILDGVAVGQAGTPGLAGPMDRRAVVSYDASEGRAAVSLEGVTAWSGQVTLRPGATLWWDLEPATALEDVAASA